MPDYTVVTHENPVLGVEKVVRVELDPSWDTIRYEDLTIIVLDDGRNVSLCAQRLWQGRRSTSDGAPVGRPARGGLFFLIGAGTALLPNQD